MNPSVVPATFVTSPATKILPDRFCSCGKGPDPKTGKTCAGKHAACGWEAGDGRVVQTGAPSRVFVADTDSAEAEAELVRRGVPRTYKVLSGSGRGYHHYFAWPGFRVGNPTSKLITGLDIRGDGGVIVAAGSPHADGGTYQVVDLGSDDGPFFAPAPAWMLSALQATSEEKRDARFVEAVEVKGEDRELRFVQARKFLRKAPLSIKGQGGRDVAFSVASTLVRLMRLPTDVAADLWEEVYNPRLIAAGTSAWSREPARRGGHSIVERLESARRTGSVPAGQAAEDGQSLADTLLASSRSLGANFSLEELAARAASTPIEGDLTRCSDTGNAELFSRMHGDAVRYVPAWRSWLVWDGARWQRDELNTVQELAKAVSARRWDEVKRMGNPEEGESQTKRARWALTTESRKGRENMIALAATEAGIPVTHETLDSDPWLLNVTNGTVDLRTGVLREHARNDHLTKLAPVAFDAGAACPTWDAFLARVTGGNRGLVDFLARAVGYSLTGDVGEQVLFFLQGAGANGKSTFTKILRELLGEYAKQAAPDLLLAKHGEAHPTEIADLHGARFALCQEVEQGRAWAEATLKQLTGGDRVKARRMREDFWEFEPTHKLWVCANHRPRVRGADEGIWRRIKLIPFDVTIPEAERDRNLLEKLRGELPGILAWAVRGCLAWQRDGLGTPDEIRLATAAYRQAEDQIAAFLEEACETGPGFEAPKALFYNAFRQWLIQSGEQPIDGKEFRDRLIAKGFSEKRTKTARVWCGVRVSDPSARGVQLATG